MRKIKISKEIKANLPNYPPAISGTSYQIIRLKLVKNLFQLGRLECFDVKQAVLRFIPGGLGFELSINIT